MSDNKQAKNTDREIWRREPGNYYSPSIHVTKEGGIGINIRGQVIVMDVEDWFLSAVTTSLHRTAISAGLSAASDLKQ